MRDIDDVIGTSLDERAKRLQGAALDPGALATLVTGVRRQRRRRQVDRGFAAVGAVAVLVAVVALGGGHESPAPAQTPTPSVTTTPSVTATPPKTATPPPKVTPSVPPRPTQAEIDAGFGLPATVPAPDGIWDQVGAGWALGIYRPLWADDILAPLRNTLVLTSPTGTAYRVRELPLDQDVALIRWFPGVTRALVTIAPVDTTKGFIGDAVRGWLDLRTGALTQDPGAVGAPDSDGYPAQISFFGVDHRGYEIWSVRYAQTGGAGPVTVVVEKPDGTLVRRIDLAGDDPQWDKALLDPSGRQVVLPGHDTGSGAGLPATVDVVNLDTGQQVAHPFGVPEPYCWVIGWSSTNELLTRCSTTQPWQAIGSWERLDAPGDAWYLVSLDGRAPRRVRTLAAGDPGTGVEPGTGWMLPDGHLVIGAIPMGMADTASCTAALYAIDPSGGVARLPVDHVRWVRPSGTLGARLYLVADVGCEDSQGTRTQLESLDGATRTPLLRPAASTDTSLGDALSSWAVAGGPSGRPGL